MVCTITINEPQAYALSGSTILTSVKISGTAENCTKVKVEISCIDGEIIPHDAVVDDNNEWTATFTEAELKLAICTKCNDPKFVITVNAKCLDTGQICPASWGPGVIPCSPCPEIVKIVVPKPTGCVGPGSSATVEVTVTVEPAVSGCKLHWVFSDGFDDYTSIPTSSSSQEFTYSHPYTLAQPNPSVSVGVICDFCDGNTVTQGFDDIEQCPDRGDGDHKPWRWPDLKINLCLILGIALAIAIAVYIVGIATGVVQDIIAELPELIALILAGAEITADTLVGIIGGVLGAAIAAYSMRCGPCYLWKALVAGVVLAWVTIGVLAISGVPSPNLVAALWITLGLMLVAWYAYNECMKKKRRSVQESSLKERTMV